jgi:hypothetical protein
MFKLFRDDFGKVFFRLCQGCELRALMESKSVNDVCPHCVNGSSLALLNDWLLTFSVNVVTHASQLHCA